MKRKSSFLWVCTIAYPFLFILGILALRYAERFLPREAAWTLGRLYVQGVAPVLPLLSRLFRAGIEVPGFLSFVLFIANGYLYALTLWHARAAYKRLRNLPPSPRFPESRRNLP